MVVGPQGDHYIAREGRPVAEIVGRSPDRLLAEAADFVRRADLDAVREGWERLAATPGRRDAVSFWVKHPDGHMVQLRASGVNRTDDELGAVLIRVSVLATKTATSRSMPPTTDPPPESGMPSMVPAAPQDAWRGGELLPSDVFQDLLQTAIDRKETKVWNAPSFARAIAKDRRYDYSLVLLDMDRTKLLRTGLPKDIVDAAAVHVAERLSESLRGRDAMGYLGPSELAILLDGVGDVHHAMRVTDTFLQLLDDPIVVGEHSFAVVPAVGVATSERRYAKAEDMMRDASAAVARALRKSGGRRRQAFQTNMRLEDRKRIMIMADLHDALVREELYLAYQPIVSLRDGRLAGFEALARWEHPNLGFVSPADFIPLAEEMGLIRELGRYVLDKACRQMFDWNESWSGPRPLVISVNASPHQLSDDSLVPDVEATLRRTKLPGHQLRIEITESAVLQDLEATLAMVKKLKSQGVTFALDDFGTGYSSLSYLHQLPYDRLKIDRAFLMQMSQTMDRVLNSIIRLAHALNMEVVAEGVETDAQKGQLERMSCDYAQGYLLSRPIKAEEAEGLVRSDPRW